MRPRGSNATSDDSEIDSETPPDRRAAPRANDAASVRIHWVHTHLMKEAIRPHHSGHQEAISGNIDWVHTYCMRCQRELRIHLSTTARNRVLGYASAATSALGTVAPDG